MLLNPIHQKTFPNVFDGYQYALDIVEGRIVSCVYVKGACQRFLDDYANFDAPFYFDPEKAEKYLKLVQRFKHVIGTWDTPEIIYQPWQKFIWMNIIGFISTVTKCRRYRIAHIEVARGNAKALCLNTDIPTPDRGLIKFRDIQIGDLLYGSDGKICRVLNKNQTHIPESYRITFSDKTFVDCSDKHLWVTSSKKERGLGTKSVKTTHKIFESQKVLKENNHSVELAKAVEGWNEDCQLPYVLGYWLGDGNSRTGRFTAHEDQFKDIKNRFKSKKLKIVIESKKGKAITFLIPALTYWLKELNLINNKHIPEKYFTASEDVRRELLRGLMDSDGTVSKEIGNFTFCNVNGRLAQQTRKLVASLGYKATIRKSKTSCQGFTGIAYYVTFSSPTTRPSIFGIRSKEDKRSNRPTRYCNKRYITKVEKISNKPMFCIEVDSPDRTFLITDQYIPTHNSAMASQAVLFMLALDDNIQGNQISCVATKRDQAKIVLGSAMAMAKKSPTFLFEKGVKVMAHTIEQKDTNSKAYTLASRDDSLDGLNDVLAVLDELHAMEREVFDVIYSGMSKRKDSLTLCITTAGFNMDSVGFSQSEYAKQVCEGKTPDEQMFAIVYTLDEEDIKNDKGIFNPEVWIKANPNYGVSVDPTTFIAKAAKAKYSAADLPNFKVKHLNIWISEGKAFYDVNKWRNLGNPELKLEDFAGCKGRLAIDVASKIDLCSLGYVFKRDDKYYLFDRSYIPEQRVQQLRNSLYDNAIASGHLFMQPGDAIDQEIVEKQVLEDSKLFKIQDILYDPWNAIQMGQNLQKKRLPVTEFRMTVQNLSEPTKTLDALIRQGRVVHNGSPLLQWCLGNVVCKFDAADNVFPRKNHERLKIDPIIAILMALASLLQDEKTNSVYETRGIRFM